jgi:hypothetical protein
MRTPSWAQGGSARPQSNPESSVGGIRRLYGGESVKQFVDVPQPRYPSRFARRTEEAFTEGAEAHRFVAQPRRSLCAPQVSLAPWNWRNMGNQIQNVFSNVVAALG